MFSDDRDDVDISINIDFIEQLVGIVLSIVVLQHLYEIAAFDQRDDLFEADSPSWMSQAFLSGSKA